MVSQKEQKALYDYNWKKPLKQLNDTLEKYEEFIIRERHRRKLIRKIDREIQSATLSADNVYKIILEEGLNEINADYGHIYQIDGNKLKLIANRGSYKVDKEMLINSSLCGRAILESEIKNIGDVNHLTPGEYHLLHEDTISELAIPIKDYRDVKDLGVLNIERRTKGQFNDDEIGFCKMLGGQIAIAMEQVKVWEGVRLIYELSSELLSGETDLKETYDLVLKRILQILDFNLGQILLVEQDKLIIVASRSPEDIGLAVGADDSVCGAYIFNKKGRDPLIINDIESSEYKKYYKWLLGKSEQRKMASEFVVPLLSNGKVVGVINIEDPRLSAFSEFDTHILNILGNMVAEAIESTKRRKEIEDFQNAKGADLVLTQLGHLSIGFLHNFGGKIGNAKARLATFIRSVSDMQLPDFNGKSGIQFLQGILQNLRDSEDLIKNFRARFDPKKLDISLKRIDILSATKEAIQRANKLKSENINISFHIDKTLNERESIECSLTEQFDEILDSLLNNAIEAIYDEGKIEIHVRLKDPLTVEISIKDTGDGMSKEVQSKIYDFGFTTKRKKRRGQGLGMWFVKMYVNRFAGKIVFNSYPGKGTTFYLSFPISFSEESSFSLSTQKKF